jgi:hypothetical protein
MPELFDKPQSALKLADGELAALKARLPRWATKKYGESAIVDAEYLRRGWHGTIGGCRLLTVDRYLAVGQRLVDDGYKILDLAWAVRAYADEIASDVWRRQNPKARLTFEAFFKSGRLDIYISAGEQLRDQDRNCKSAAAARRAENEQRDQRAALYAEYKALPAAERAKLLEQALVALGGAALAFGRRDESNPTIRNMICKLIQRRRQQNRLDVAPIGSVLE